MWSLDLVHEITYMDMILYQLVNSYPEQKALDFTGEPGRRPGRIKWLRSFVSTLDCQMVVVSSFISRFAFPVRDADLGHDPVFSLQLEQRAPVALLRPDAHHRLHAVSASRSGQGGLARQVDFIAGWQSKG